MCFSSVLFEQPADGCDERVLDIFAEGLDAYEAGLFQEAVRQFERAIAIREDGPSRVFLERARTLAQNPPTDWDGVYRFTEK